jgi:hypothetical protein
LLNTLARKYMGVDKFPFNQPGEKRVVVVVEPQHVTHFGS